MSNWVPRAVVIWIFLVLLAFSLPLLSLAYYFLRLKLRKRFLLAKILELDLECEYLRVFHFAEWEKFKKKEGLEVRKHFENIFTEQFQSDNSFNNFILPLLLTSAATLFFAYFGADTLTSGGGKFEKDVLVYAMGGAFLYILPLYVSHYASLSLNPQIQLDLLGRFLLSTLIGIAAAGLFTASLQPIAGFLGGLLPLPSLEILKKKVLDEKTDQEARRVTAMLEILHEDRNLLSQLDYVGIRSALQLAYENPLRIFVETDLNLVASIDLVDQANLHLYVPEEEIRKGLNRYGIRTAIDLMTQLYDTLPKAEGKPGEVEYRCLKSMEPLPAYLQEPLKNISKVMNLESLDALRNLIQMMVDNPQLQYVLDLWNRVSDSAAIWRHKAQDMEVKRDQALAL